MWGLKIHRVNVTIQLAKMYINLILAIWPYSFTRSKNYCLIPQNNIYFLLSSGQRWTIFYDM